MAVIVRKPLPVRQDQQVWVDILKADPTRSNKWINRFSATLAITFVVLALSVLSVTMLRPIVADRQPPEYLGLGALAFGAVVVADIAAIIWLWRSTPKRLRQKIRSLAGYVILASFAVLTALFIFFILWEFLQWLAAPSSLPSSLELGDLIANSLKAIFH